MSEKEEEKGRDEFETEEYDDFEDVAGDGYLNHSLTRSSSQIRKDRGAQIAEDIKLAYKRKVEDLEMEVKRMKRKMKGAFDFSPNSTFSLVLAENVEGIDVVEEDMSRALDLRNLKVKLILAKKRYNYLFGQEYQLNEELV